MNALRADAKRLPFKGTRPGKVEPVNPQLRKAGVRLREWNDPNNAPTRKKPRDLRPRRLSPRLPGPAASAAGPVVQRAFNAKDGRARHDNCFYLFESLIKLAACPLIAAYVRQVRSGGERMPKLDGFPDPISPPIAGPVVGIPVRAGPLLRQPARRGEPSARARLGAVGAEAPRSGGDCRPVSADQERAGQPGDLGRELFAAAVVRRVGAIPQPGVRARGLAVRGVL